MYLARRKPLGCHNNENSVLGTIRWDSKFIPKHAQQGKIPNLFQSMKLVKWDIKPQNRNEILLAVVNDDN